MSSHTDQRRQSSHETANEPSLWRARLILLAVVLAFAAVWYFGKLRPAQQAANAVKAPEVRRKPAKEIRFNGRVVLGSPSLVGGIPGGEKVTLEQIRRWLDDPKNHEPIDFELPLWLRDDRDSLTLPEDDPLTRAKIELGRQLYMEGRMVKSGFFLCVDCHHPDQAYSRASVFTHKRNPLPTFNRILSTYQFWDGRAESLEKQVEVPVRHPEEMNKSPEENTATLAAIPGYRLQFERIYGDVTFGNVCRAIAAFERALVTGPASYDYRRVLNSFSGRDPASMSDEERATYDEAKQGAASHPMSEAAIRGETLFFSDRAGCANCHSGPNFTDEQFHNLGVGLANLDDPTYASSYNDLDLGRQAITHDEADYGAFKTPTLRNLRQTSPYMHDGQIILLEEAVEFLVNGGQPNKNLSPMIGKRDLSKDEIKDLVAFLDSLQGDLAQAPRDGLPE